MIKECGDCADAGCIDGRLDGMDGDGRETSDECNCPCHLNKHERDSDRTYDDMKENRGFVR